MPYIKKYLREFLDEDIDGLVNKIAKMEDRTGPLAYVVYRLLRGTMPSERFKHYSSSIGVLEAVKLEFYRRKVAKYEDLKAREEGDV